MTKIVAGIPTLQLFLEILIGDYLMKKSRGHAITNSSKRYILSPLFLGLGVELELYFGSK